jgi:hypothetical protein
MDNCAISTQEFFQRIQRMKTSAVPQGGARLVLAAITALVGAVLLALVLAGSAAVAAPIAKDGKIHACYQVKGKRKGALRVVSGNRCRRGERKVAWIATGSVGAPGQQGARGGQGSQGPAGPPGAAADSGLLEARIAALTLKVEGLEGLLAGITRADLLGAIGGLASLDALCDQTAALTNQANLLRGAIAGLSLNNALTLLGGLLNIPALPVALPVFDCP